MPITISITCWENRARKIATTCSAAKLGGPLSIPKVYDGKNKTFFFVNYEGLIQASPYNLTSTVPYGAYATGNFSASPTLVYDPATKAPFPRNAIPANLIDPAALKILGLVPAPNSPGTINKTDNIATNNFVSIGSSHPTTNTGLARLDETVTNSLRLFGTFIHFNNYSPIQPTYPGSPLENSVGNTETTGYESSAGLTKIWSPTFITEVRFGFFRNNAEIVPPSAGINVPSALGIGTSYGEAAPEINISGFSQLGANSNTQRSQIDNNYQTYVNNSKDARESLDPVRVSTPEGSVRRPEPDWRRERELYLHRRDHQRQEQRRRSHQRAGGFSAGRHQDRIVFAGATFDRKAQLQCRLVYSATIGKSVRS